MEHRHTRSRRESSAGLSETVERSRSALERDFPRSGVPLQNKQHHEPRRGQKTTGYDPLWRRLIIETLVLTLFFIVLIAIEAPWLWREKRWTELITSSVMLIGTYTLALLIQTGSPTPNPAA